MSHPLQRIGLVVAAAFALWGFAAILNAVLGSYWFGLGIGLFIALIVWRAVSEYAATLAGNVGRVFQTEPFRGFGIAVLLTLVYGLIAYGVFVPYRGVLQNELLTDPRIVTALAIVTGLLATAPLVLFYEPVGIPFRAKTVFRSSWILSILVFGVTAYIIGERPNNFFDVESGKPKFMVAEEEGEMYRLDPQRCAEQGGCFSPATGERLRPGTSEDARRYGAESWLKAEKHEERRAHAVAPLSEPNCYALGKWVIPLVPGTKSMPVCWPEHLARKDAPYGLDFVVERSNPNVAITYHFRDGNDQYSIVQKPGDQHLALPRITRNGQVRFSAKEKVTLTFVMTPTPAPE